MTEWRLRRRARLKHKEAHTLRDQISASLGGASLWADDAAVELAEVPGMQVIVLDHQPVGLLHGQRPFLTVRGLQRFKPDAAYVTVDMGAVRFVTNGADVMGPGIVDADARLQPDDWCWVRDERNRQPLAVGLAVVSGEQMATKPKGKAVKSIHWVGDKLWNLAQE